MSEPAKSSPLSELCSAAFLYEAAASPGFIPGLTGGIAIAQSLAAVTFPRDGTGARKRLQETEARLAATSQRVEQKG